MKDTTGRGAASSSPAGTGDRGPHAGAPAVRDECGRETEQLYKPRADSGNGGRKGPGPARPILGSTDNPRMRPFPIVVSLRIVAFPSVCVPSRARVGPPVTGGHTARRTGLTPAGGRAKVGPARWLRFPRRRRSVVLAQEAPSRGFGQTPESPQRSPIVDLSAGLSGHPQPSRGLSNLRWGPVRAKKKTT